MHVSCRNRGIVELDYLSVFASEEERGELVVVKSLDLSHNKLVQLGGLQPFSSLVTLDLSFNKLLKLQGLPLGIVRLNVSNNELTSLEGISTLPFLQELDASNNKVSTIAMQRSSPILKLNLSHNRIASVLGLQNLPQLQTLELEQNYIKEVSDLRPLTTCVKLSLLTLQGNPVSENPTYWSKISQMLPSLTSIDAIPVQKVAGQRTPSKQTPNRAAGEVRSRSSTPLRYVYNGRRTGGFQTPKSSQHQQPHPQPQPQQQQQQQHSHQGSPEQQQDIMSSKRSHTPTTSIASRTPLRDQGPMLAADISTNTIHQSESQIPHSNQRTSSLAFNSVRQRSEARRGDLNSSNRKLEVDVTELRNLLEEEYKLTTKLQKGKRRVEAELSELKTVLSDELNKVQELKATNNQLESDLRLEQEAVAKMERSHQHSLLKLSDERQRGGEEIERLKREHRNAFEQIRAKLNSESHEGENSRRQSQKWEEERNKFLEFISILEKENRQLAIALSKHENAAADNISHDVSGLGSTGIKVSWSPSNEKHSSRQQQQQQQQNRAQAPDNSDHIKKSLFQASHPAPSVSPGRGRGGQRDARQLIQMSRSANADNSVAVNESNDQSTTFISSRPQQSTQPDIQWAAAPEIDQSSDSQLTNNKQALDIAVQLKKWLRTEDQNFSGSPHPHDIRGSPSVEALWYVILI